MSNLIKSSGSGKSTTKFSVKGVDLTNPSQKLLALFGVGAGLVGVYYLMNFAITFLITLGNLLLLIGGVSILGILLIYLAMNWQNIWMFMKQLTWRTTKWMISKDNFGVMYRYLAWLDKQIVDITNGIINIDASLNQLKDEVRSLQKELKDRFDLLIKLEDKTKNGELTPIEKNQYQKLSNEVVIYKDSIATYIPMIEDAKIRLEFLEPLKQFMINDKDAFQTSIVVLEKQYEFAKKNNEAINSAEKFFSTNTHHYKLYAESRKQVEERMYTYEAKFKNFSKEFSPILANAELSNELKHDRVKDMLDAYRNSQISLSLDITNSNKEEVKETNTNVVNDAIQIESMPLNMDSNTEDMEKVTVSNNYKTIDNSILEALDYKP